MHNTSQIFMLLLNIYFNLGMINPYLHRNEFTKLTNLTSEIFGISLPVSESPEAKLDQLMQDYVIKLKEVKSIKDDSRAILAMEAARKTFMKRAEEIRPELNQWLSALSEEEADTYKENLLLKPYFKDINDITMGYQLSNKLEANQQLKNSFEAMDDFLALLY